MSGDASTFPTICAWNAVWRASATSPTGLPASRRESVARELDCRFALAVRRSHSSVCVVQPILDTALDPDGKGSRGSKQQNEQTDR